jgi:predicted helicase
MYARFFRWASDRLAADGVLAFVTNRSFVESRTFDGFRKTIGKEFSEAYIVDLGGDVRANPKLSGTKHNVFGIQTGVAISFLVKREADAKKKTKPPCRVFYVRRPEMETAEEKLAFVSSTRVSDVAFEEMRPDALHNWLGSSYLHHMPGLADKEVKAGRGSAAVFRLFAWGNSSNRDEWVYDANFDTEVAKAKFMVDTYTALRLNGDHSFPETIKWSADLKTRFAQGRDCEFNRHFVVASHWRPFRRAFLYAERLFNDRLTDKHAAAFGHSFDRCNEVLMVCGHPQLPFTVHAVDGLPDAGYASRATQMFPRWVYAQDGSRVDNITDWSLDQFRKHYQPGRGKKARPITKEAIFHYVYAVLHDPQYREKYALNLKREFPRIPLYGGSDAVFWQWAGWGEALMALHIGYESVEPFALKRTDIPDEKVRAAGQAPKCVLKADREGGRIVVDSETVLSGVPSAAWRYRLGNRCAIEWVLDQYKEKKPKDPTIREKFDTYRFADHKEHVIDLLARVTTVSERTMAIVDAMLAAPR